MNIEWKTASKTKVINRMLHNRLNKARYHYRKAKGKAQAESTTQTSQITVGQKILGLVC